MATFFRLFVSWYVGYIAICVAATAGLWAAGVIDSPLDYHHEAFAKIIPEDLMPEKKQVPGIGLARTEYFARQRHSDILYNLAMPSGAALIALIFGLSAFSQIMQIVRLRVTMGSLPSPSEYTVSVAQDRPTDEFRWRFPFLEMGEIRFDFRNSELVERGERKLAYILKSGTILSFERKP
jgi:hypothetical protein